MKVRFTPEYVRKVLERWKLLGKVRGTSKCPIV